jgi:diaminohydroxyphosphoribosylaminopyrimidine deaminase/5-amino-6-(5-phosphoribosylamino)uracil reductase
MTTRSPNTTDHDNDAAFDRAMMKRACRLAWRGTGGVSPNPRVGCVIVDHSKSIIGWGCHRVCGGPHAEAVALQRAGAAARSATAYVTLEPCNHVGRTGPCSEALIQAGVQRVVYAVRDPHPSAQGGAERLRAAGVQVEQCEAEAFARWVSAPFVHRVQTGRPWVIAKWAQTLDGRIATRTGESQWISNAASRRLSHRWRGQVDAILTGIGTVLADDPQLTARNVRTHRQAMRIVLDIALQIPIESVLVRTARDVPTIIITDVNRAGDDSSTARMLRDAGVQVAGFACMHGEFPMTEILQWLSREHEVGEILVDAGGGVLGRLFAQGLVNEARVCIAPLLLGDDLARPCLRGMTSPALTDGVRLHTQRSQRRGDDLIVTYSVQS